MVTLLLEGASIRQLTTSRKPDRTRANDCVKAKWLIKANLGQSASILSPQSVPLTIYPPSHCVIGSSKSQLHSCVTTFHLETSVILEKASGAGWLCVEPKKPLRVE